MGVAEEVASPKRLHRGIRTQPRCPCSSSCCSLWRLRELSSVATKTRVTGRWVGTRWGGKMGAQAEGSGAARGPEGSFA